MATHQYGRLTDEDEAQRNAETDQARAATVAQGNFSAPVIMIAQPNINPATVPVTYSQQAGTVQFLPQTFIQPSSLEVNLQLIISKRQLLNEFTG